jgi:hypothetical protein
MHVFEVCIFIKHAVLGDRITPVVPTPLNPRSSPITQRLLFVSEINFSRGRASRGLEKLKHQDNQIAHSQTVAERTRSRILSPLNTLVLNVIITRIPKKLYITRRN